MWVPAAPPGGFRELIALQRLHPRRRGGRRPLAIDEPLSNCRLFAARRVVFAVGNHCSWVMWRPRTGDGHRRGRTQVATRPQTR